jgi:hypothetical protein
MKWNEIEVKWAAMTRRVGSECKPDDSPTATGIPADLPDLQPEPTELRAPMPRDCSAP